MTNQINRYNVRFGISLECFSLQMLVPWNWNTFLLLEWGIMAGTSEK